MRHEAAEVAAEVLVVSDGDRYSWAIVGAEGRVLARSVARFETADEARRDGDDWLERMPRESGTSEQNKSGTGTTDWSSGLLAVGAALIVGSLAALGVTGDLLARMVRNEPDRVAIPLYLVIACGGVLTAMATLGGTRRATERSRSARAVPYVTAAAAMVVAAAMIYVVWVGKESQETRERPAVDMSIERSSDGTYSLSASGTSTSLKSRERLILQVIRLRKEPDDFEQHKNVCIDAMSVVERHTIAYGEEFVDFLSWQEVGPDQSGAATAQVSFPLADDVEVGDRFCALARLINRGPVPGQYAVVAVNVTKGPLKTYDEASD